MYSYNYIYIYACIDIYIYIYVYMYMYVPMALLQLHYLSPGTRRFCLESRVSGVGASRNEGYLGSF